MKKALALVFLALAACIEAVPPSDPPAQARTSGVVGEATMNRIAARVMPVAEAECRARTSNLSCDYVLTLDRRADQPPNAFQTIDKDGRPTLIFNVALLNDLESQHELAFIMGHEAAHHIRRHLQQTNTNATAGAVLGGVFAAVLGADPGTINTAQRAGAVVGGRAYSKEFELEADALGTVITKRAGYDPVRGAQYFTRIADPGNRFLGTHPPNAERLATVRRVAASM